ncbi:MAG: hypothetical protein BWY62_00286 [Firmicutes bacterium ADurb.Bin356]|nr:MAG: hypothetical protein BWY62_00286 [Firmicutes bacterium ADurb.Bin356]
MYCASSRSPWSTCTSTEVCPSAAVENIWLFFVGIVVLRSISLVNTPPTVSMPSERGVTSRSRMSLTSPPSTPACIAAPIATHSSGFIPLNGSLPVTALTISCTEGVLLEPPTSITLSILSLVRLESRNARNTHSLVLSTRSDVSSLNFARLSVISKCFGPDASIVINGRLIFVCAMPESSIFAFSAASLSLWSAILSFLSSTPLSFLNSAAT